MMAGHSARKRSSRRASYRQGNKRRRQATRQALAGGHSKLVRPEHWNQRPEQPLLPEDGAPAQPVKAASRKPKKDIWCPGRPGQKRHHYLTEVTEVPAHRVAVGAGWWRFGPYKQVLVLCAYCGRESTRRIHD